MDCGGDQNAFAIFARQRKYRVLHMATRLFVQKAIIPPPGCDMDLLFAYHVVELIRINAGCVYYVTGLEYAVVGGNLPTARNLF